MVRKSHALITALLLVSIAIPMASANYQECERYPQGEPVDTASRTVCNAVYPQTATAWAVAYTVLDCVFDQGPCP